MYRMPRFDMPRFGSTFRSTYSIGMSPTSQYVMVPLRHVSNYHVTHITTCDGTGSSRVHFPSLTTPSTPFVTVKVFSRDLLDHTR
jgi:hypothetical protein